MTDGLIYVADVHPYRTKKDEASKAEALFSVVIACASRLNGNSFAKSGYNKNSTKPIIIGNLIAREKFGDPEDWQNPEAVTVAKAQAQAHADVLKATVFPIAAKLGSEWEWSDDLDEESMAEMEVGDHVEIRFVDWVSPEERAERIKAERAAKDSTPVAEPKVKTGRVPVEPKE